MRASGRELAWAGFGLGRFYCLATYLILLITAEKVESRIYLYILLGHAALGLPALLFESERQLRWYWRALFVPWGSLWGGFLAVCLVQDFGALALVVWGVWVVFMGAPVVWGVGACWLWARERRRIAATAC